MKIIVSGLSEELCARVAKTLENNEIEVRHETPEEILAASGKPGDSRIVWLYAPPWSAWRSFAPDRAAPDMRTIFQDWLLMQRRLLRRRRNLGDALSLVNIEKIEPGALAKALGIDQKTAGRWKPKNPPEAVTSCLIQLCETVAPEVWDVYEALEMAAWKPQPVSPGAASEEQTPESDGLAFFQALADGSLGPLAQAPSGSDESQNEALIRKPEKALAAANLELSAAQSTISQQAKKIQLNEEQKKYEDSARRIAEEGMAKVIAEQAETIRGLLDADHDESLEENMLLWTQLHTAQEELEAYFKECHQLRISLAEARLGLDRARRVFSHVLRQGAAGVNDDSFLMRK